MHDIQYALDKFVFLADEEINHVLDRGGGGGRGGRWVSHVDKDSDTGLTWPHTQCVNCPTRHLQQTGIELSSQRPASNGLQSISRRGTPQLEPSDWPVNRPLRMRPSPDA